MTVSHKLLTWSPLICTGRILRSACPTAASEQDIDIIRHKLGISHLVSLDVCATETCRCGNLHSTWGLLPPAYPAANDETLIDMISPCLSSRWICAVSLSDQRTLRAHWWRTQSSEFLSVRAALLRQAQSCLLRVRTCLALTKQYSLCTPSGSSRHKI